VFKKQLNDKSFYAIHPLNISSYYGQWYLFIFIYKYVM